MDRSDIIQAIWNCRAIGITGHGVFVFKHLKQLLKTVVEKVEVVISEVVISKLTPFYLRPMSTVEVFFLQP